MRFSKRELFSTAAVLLALCPVAAYAAPQRFADDSAASDGAAQSAPDAGAQKVDAPEETRGLQDITVFAQRRSAGQELQKVPVAVTAVTGEMMEAAHSVNITDIGKLTPNAQLGSVGTFPGFANFFMRGVGVSSSLRSIDPAVNVIQDGMVIIYQGGAILDTFDLEGLEVLRGPQGVLFGRNASGGAVVLRSRRPGEEVKGHFDISFGNAKALETHSSVEGGLIPGLLNARLAISTRRNDGYIKNVTSGTFVNIPANVNPTGTPINHKTGGVDTTDEIVIKPTFVFTPAADTTLTLFTQYQNFDNGGGATRSYIPKSGKLSSAQTNWGYYPTTKGYETNITELGYTKIEAYHVIGELVQNFGEDALTVNAAYRNVAYDGRLSVDGNPFATTTFPSTIERNHQFSVEARYNGAIGDSLNYIIGAFYLNTDTKAQLRIDSRSPARTTPIQIGAKFSQNVKSYAGFANVDYDITDQLAVSAGVRYTKDEKSVAAIPQRACPVAGCFTDPFNYAKKSFDNWSPRVVVNYKPADDMMVYASYSKGFRSGTFNIAGSTVDAVTTPTRPELVTSYEIGAKTQFFDRHLRVNVTAFYEDYKDIQRIVQFTINNVVQNSLFNAAAAKIKGFELEVSALPVRRLRLDGSLGLTDAKYDSFIGLTLRPGQTVSSLKFDRVPKWTAHVEANYDIPIDSWGGNLSARVAYTYQSHMYTDVANTPEFEQEAYGTVDAGLTYTQNNWKVAAYVQNAFNKDFAVIKSISAGYNEYGGQPRVYGLKLGFDF